MRHPLSYALRLLNILKAERKRALVPIPVIYNDAEFNNIVHIHYTYNC